jgi:hypothetical protein
LLNDSRNRARSARTNLGRSTACRPISNRNLGEVGWWSEHTVHLQMSPKSVNRSKCENDPIMRKMTPFSGTVTHCVLQSKVHSNHWAKAARLPCALDDPARAADRRSRRSTRRSHGCSGPQLANPLESPTSVAIGLGELVEAFLPLSYAHLRTAAAR